MAEEPDIFPKFLVKANSLDTLWSQFKAEDNVVLKYLISMDAVDDFSIDFILILSILTY